MITGTGEYPAKRMRPEVLNRARFMLAALWFSVLLLPFKGLKPALILFIVLSAGILFMQYIAGFVRVLTLRLHALMGKFKAVSLSHSASLTVRISFLAFLMGFPFMAQDYFLDVVVLTGIYIILALGLNVIVGFTGLLHLGFAAFYAIGAYSYALLNTKAGLGFWYALPACAGLAALSGVVIALPALRLKGDYLAIVTLGFGEIVRLLLNNMDTFTGGPNGISGIAAPYFFGITIGRLGVHYYITLMAVILTYIVIKRVRWSKTGRAWIAIREDEICAATMGVNIMRYKLYSFAFGSFWAGLAGALFAAKMQFVSPESFTFIESVLILCMVILGGLGSIPGVIAGAIILVMLPEVLREVQTYRMLALGAGLIIMMIFRPQGLFGRS